jgi:SM-20-related protein
MILDEALLSTPPIADPCDGIAQALGEVGWTMTDDFLPTVLAQELARDTGARWRSNAFRRAGTGRAEGFRIDPRVRNDHVQWLDLGALTDAQHEYLDRLEALRLAINRTLFLGLVELEMHLSVYPPGSFYRKHLDQFRGVGERTITTVVYLNETWRETDGGQLRIYTDRDSEERYQDILPLAGRLVVFFSARFLHEVLRTRRQRMSITGWFKRRGDTWH